MSNKKLSLSDKFAQLINPTPFEDPEDDVHEETTAQVVNFDDSSDEEEEELAPSILRRRNAAGLVDGRYAGEKISRRTFDENSDDEDVGSSKDEQSEPEESSDEEAEMSRTEEKYRISSSDDDRTEEDLYKEENSEDGEGSESSCEEEDRDGDMFAEKEEDSNFQHFSNKDVNTDIDKGRAVRNQLGVWDNILEFRIQVQKSLILSNQLPTFNQFNDFKSEGGKEFSSTQSLCVQKISNLFEKLSKLQEELLKQNSETKNLGNGKRLGKSLEADDEEITSSEDEESDGDDTEATEQPHKKRKLGDCAKLLETSHKKFIGFRNTTIQKWSDKTRVAQGRASSKNFNAFEQSTLKQIEHVLMDKERLLKRTRMKRSAHRVMGQEEPLEKDNDNDRSQEFNPEIFDDDDFYHQLLRELIEHKTENITDPVQLGRQWIALQKLRNKMKRKIDTRATKGRKTRYVVHPKLVNFMAPYDKSSWSEEQKSELFNSLFSAA